MTLPQFIRAVRKANDLTQTELAELTDCTQASISKYETDTEPSIQFIRRFRQVFGYDLIDENVVRQKPEKRYNKKKPVTYNGIGSPSILIPILQGELENMRISLERLQKAVKQK